LVSDAANAKTLQLQFLVEKANNAGAAQVLTDEQFSKLVAYTSTLKGEHLT